MSAAASPMTYDLMSPDAISAKFIAEWASRLGIPCRHIDGELIVEFTSRADRWRVFCAMRPWDKEFRPLFTIGCRHKPPASTQTDYLGLTPRGFRTVVVDEDEDGDPVVAREPIY